MAHVAHIAVQKKKKLPLNLTKSPFLGGGGGGCWSIRTLSPIRTDLREGREEERKTNGGKWGDDCRFEHVYFARRMPLACYCDIINMSVCVCRNCCVYQ